MHSNASQHSPLSPALLPNAQVPEVLEWLTPAECERVLRSVYSMRGQWTHRVGLSGPLPAFTLGAASYLDKHRASLYSDASNAQLRREFGELVRSAKRCRALSAQAFPP